MTLFKSSCNNLVLTVAAPYAPGSGMIQVEPGGGTALAGQIARDGFPPVSAAAPVRFTAFLASGQDGSGRTVVPDGQLIPTTLTVYTATGVDTTLDRLTGVAADIGQIDQPFGIGDGVAFGMTGRQMWEYQNALHAIEAGGGAPIGIGGTVGGGTTGELLYVGAGGVIAQAPATGLVKGNGTTFGAAAAGVDYLAPNGSGSALTNLNASALNSGTIPTARMPIFGQILCTWQPLPAPSGGVITIDWSVADRWYGTLPNTSVTFAYVNVPPAGTVQVLTLRLTQPASGATCVVTWPTGSLFPNGSAPSLSGNGKSDTVSILLVRDGISFDTVLAYPNV